MEWLNLKWVGDTMDNKSDLSDNIVRVDFKNTKPERSPVRTQEQELLNQNKRELFAQWIREGTTSVLFDARQKNVKVPMEFRARGDLRLNFCYNFNIADFNFNGQAIFATLSFDSGEYFCSVPWDAIYGLQSLSLNQGAVWFLCFPSDLDQTTVLGFSEEVLEMWSKEPQKDDSCDDKLDNIISFDFSSK